VSDRWAGTDDGDAEGSGDTVAGSDFQVQAELSWTIDRGIVQLQSFQSIVC
jgi:hypothetical protein